MYDFARKYFGTGIVRLEGWPNGDKNVESGVFTLEEKPEYLRVSWSAWNKAYRRSFINDEDFAFYPGYYSDYAWTPPVLLTAQRIAILDRACLCYRKGRPGSFTKSSGKRHFEIFDQYSRISDFLQRRAEYSHWRGAILDCSITQLFRVVVTSRRISGELMPEFNERCIEHFRGYPAKLSVLKTAIESEKMGEVRTGY
jgi:hypothetical protein